MNENIMITSNAFSNNGGSYYNHNTDYGHSTKASNISGNDYIEKANVFVNKKNLQIVAKSKGILNNDDNLIKLYYFPGQICNSFITGLFAIGYMESILRPKKHNSTILLNDSRNIAIEADVVDKKHVIIHQAALSCIDVISKKISRLNKILLQGKTHAIKQSCNSAGKRSNRWKISNAYIYDDRD